MTYILDDERPNRGFNWKGLPPQLNPCITKLGKKKNKKTTTSTDEKPEQFSLNFTGDPSQNPQPLHPPVKEDYEEEHIYFGIEDLEIDWDLWTKGIHHV